MLLVLRLNSARSRERSRLEAALWPVSRAGEAIHALARSAGLPTTCRETFAPAPDLTPDQMIATLAHELQHAVEVVEDSAVTDEKTLVALYKRIGRPNRTNSSTGWETVAAQEAGYQVRRELVSVPASAAVRAAISSQS